MPHLERGCVQLYTGDARERPPPPWDWPCAPAGSGMKTVMIQFMKGQPCGELEASGISGGLITVEQFARPEFYMAGKSNILEHYSLCRRAWPAPVISSKQAPATNSSWTRRPRPYRWPSCQWMI
jgi:ATP:corrinoid adenosyltransferase